MLTFASVAFIFIISYTVVLADTAPICARFVTVVTEDNAPHVTLILPPTIVVLMSHAIPLACPITSAMMFRYVLEFWISDCSCATGTNVIVY